jgi:hypothetical protein
MRLFGAVLAVCLLALGADRAGAQGYCPFLAFCDAQQSHCYSDCGALTNVVAWPDRPAFLQRCFAKCDVQFGRCTVRSTRRCLRRRY